MGNAKSVAKYGDKLTGHRPREPDRTFEVRLERVVGGMCVTIEGLAEHPRMERGRPNGTQICTRAVLTVQPKTNNRDGQLRQTDTAGPILDEAVAPQRVEPELGLSTQVLVPKPPDGGLRRGRGRLEVGPQATHGLERLAQAKERERRVVGSRPVSAVRGTEQRRRTPLELRAGSAPTRAGRTSAPQLPPPKGG